MSKSKYLISVLLLGDCAILGACTRVPPGSVGIKVNMLGGEKGVDMTVHEPGRVWQGVNEEVYVFPLYVQEYTWSHENSQAIQFQTVDGMQVKADVGIRYTLDKAKVPLIFQRYRKGVEEITNSSLRNMVRDALVQHASSREIESVYGAGKTKLIEDVQATVVAQVRDIGINIEKVYWSGEIVLPDNVKRSINDKIQATQIAIKKENELKAAEADAAKEVAAAKGEADAALLRAKAEAESIQIKAQALRANNELIELEKVAVQKIAASRWNGSLPTHLYGSAPLPFVDITKK